MLNWINDNRQWLFDGLGVAVPLAFLSWIGSRFFGRRQSNGQRQHGGENSVNIQAGRDARIENINKKNR